jgi:hypothetical protein
MWYIYKKSIGGGGDLQAWTTVSKQSITTQHCRVK